MMGAAYFRLIELSASKSISRHSLEAGMRFVCSSMVVLSFLVCGLMRAAAVDDTEDSRPRVTLYEFFNSVDLTNVQISPDGGAVVFVTGRADWEANRFRNDLWLYREAVGAGGADSAAAGSGLVQLTSSGHDDSPQWSPDGKWIAFLSDRAGQGAEDKEEGAEKGRWGEGGAEANQRDEGGRSDAGRNERDHHKAEPEKQIFVIAVAGGEAFPVTEMDEGVDALAWAADSRGIFFASKVAQSKLEKAAQEKEWKDVIRFRESERGDSISRVDVGGVEEERVSGKTPANLAGRTHELCKIADRVAELVASPDGRRLAIRTEARSERWEKTEPFAIYVAEVAGPDAATTATSAPTVTPRLISQKPAFYDRIRWAADNRHVFFSFLNGSAEGGYRDAQERIYWVDAGEEGSGGGGEAGGERGAVNQQQRWAGDFGGSTTEVGLLANGSMWAGGRMGTEVAPYTQTGVSVPFVKA